MALKFTKLTRNNLRNLKSGRSLCEHGIIFERLKNGDGRYVVNVMVDGQRVHRVIGKESDGVTRLQAEELVEKLKTDARHGRFNLPKGRKDALVFSEAVKLYLAKSEKEDGRDLKAKTYRLKLNMAPFFKDIPISKISGFDVERYKKYRKENKIKPGTINRELAALSHLFTKAVEWGWIDSRPCKINRMKEDSGRITYLTVEQAQRLLDTAKKDQNPYIYLFILIGLETSMRKMEILSIKIENIDLQRQQIFIPEAKSGARAQPITNNLANYLQQYLKAIPADQLWLFPSEKSATGHTVNVEKSFRRVVIEAGLNPKEVVRHTLRHTAITHLVQAGVDLPTVQRISGHKTLNMVVKYSHQNGEHIRSAMDLLEKRYASKTEAV